MNGSAAIIINKIKRCHIGFTGKFVGLIIIKKDNKVFA